MTKRQPRYKIGDIIGKRKDQYRVYQVHMGGMGEVYLCLDKDQIPYAFKTFQATSPALRGLFEDEVKKWVGLGKHPNIVRCHWMGVFDNTPFMGLDWISGDEYRGADLRGWLRHGALDLKQALKFAIDIVRGLVYVGEKSGNRIVHRDLKPDNVLVAQGGLAKITDFGLATIINKAGLSDETDDNSDFDAGKSRYVGNMVGTPVYMPPEQWRGDADIDPRADMYAVGCILYEMLTGRMAYVASTISQMRLQHFETPIPTAAGAPNEVNTIINKCMAKNRADRYPTMTALLEALTQFYEAHIGETLPPVQVEELIAEDYSNRGMTYANLKLYDLALADYDEAIRLDPTYATAYSNRGTSYGALGQPERAIADYDEAIRLDPMYATAWFNKGAVYGNIRRLQEALACFERAYQLGYLRALGAIQQVKQMMGNPAPPPPQNNDAQVAFEAFQRATSLDAMRQAVGQYPILKDMIQTIQQVIQMQVPPHLKPEFETRLNWLIQIAKGE